MVKCFLCVKQVRSAMFPGVLKFWVPNGKLVYAETEKFGGYFRMCKECAAWSVKNTLAASELIYARVLRIEQEEQDDEEAFDADDNE